MSYIRPLAEPEWEDIEKGLYVYSDGESIQYMPGRHEPFIEVVMRMLDQEGSLDEETLSEVHTAFRNRLNVDND